MDLTFVNGNDLQKSACLSVAHGLINLPFDSIPLTITVEFVRDPLPSEHNEFAATTWSYGSFSARMKIAAIAPGWPEPWRGVQFLQEVFAHELGHALYAALPKSSRVAIAQMFGANTDLIEVLNPSSSGWEDRIMEGIAETFKDAFLPPRMRRYFNRTNRRLSIAQYRQFRAIFRDGVVGQNLEFNSPDGTDSYRISGYNGDGIYSGDYTPSPNFSLYLSFGRYLQLAGSGEPLSMRIERNDDGSLAGKYDINSRINMVWAEEFIDGPQKEFTLPPNTGGGGWRFRAVGETGGVVFSGGTWRFGLPMYAYEGRNAQLLFELEFQFGLGSSFNLQSDLNWGDYQANGFIDGSPPLMGLDTETPLYPPGGNMFYVFSSIELPISTETGGLELNPTMSVTNHKADPPSQADITEATNDLFRGGGEALELPASEIEPTDVTSRTRRLPRDRRVVGSHFEQL